MFFSVRRVVNSAKRSMLARNESFHFALVIGHSRLVHSAYSNDLFQSLMGRYEHFLDPHVRILAFGDVLILVIWPHTYLGFSNSWQESGRTSVEISGEFDSSSTAKFRAQVAQGSIPFHYIPSL